MMSRRETCQWPLGTFPSLPIPPHPPPIGGFSHLDRRTSLILPESLLPMWVWRRRLWGNPPAVLPVLAEASRISGSLPMALSLSVTDK